MRTLIILAAIGVVYLILRWQYQKNPQKFTKKFVYWITVFGIGALILLAVTGRLHWLFALIAGLVPLAGRVISLLRFLPVLRSIQAAFGAMKNNGQASTGNSSSVESRYFRMKLDHDTGEMDGTILEGELQGKQLSDVDLPTLLKLLRECQAADQDSAALLIAYLDRRYPEGWREQSTEEPEGEPRQPSLGNEMTRDEALHILGLTEPVVDKDIIKAHRRLMQKFHPDRGGSNYLAAKINAAKEFLLVK